ncbi:hypothetical protein Sjap_009549 [Stephania japonica]|uniref:CRIB domain-containing protein n=1 Tax=Stephania japonica TaxID=461633 RepID=A0AAP0PFK9_9MAGN
MRDRMERLVVLPFSMGCSSHSSIAVIETSPKKSKPADDQSNNIPSAQKAQGEESLSGANMKGSLGLLPLPKPNFRLQRLMKGFKNFSQLFVYKEDVEELDMEIGFPTDVKHVTHIGWDGPGTTNPLKGWESLRGPQELLSLPALSLRQFELAMATQADHEPLVLGSSKLS